MAVLGLLLGVMGAKVLEVAGGITLRGVRCGQLTCTTDQYCSQLESRCAPCTGICDSSNHNYDMNLCIEQCQDYLHDLLYVRKDHKGSDEDFAELKAKVQRLQLILTIIGSILFVVAVVFFCFKSSRYLKVFFHKLSWTWIRKKLQSPKKTSQDKIPAELKPETSGGNVMAPQPLSACALQLNAGPLHRQAAEDSSLDHSYDNMALNLPPSPIENAPRPEI